MKSEATHGDLPGFLPLATFSLNAKQYTLSALDKPLPKAAGIYAFIQGGAVKYVGSSKGGFHGRMNDYLRWQVNGGGRNNRPVHLSLRAALIDGPITVMFLGIGDVLGEWEGLPIHLIDGIENGLIYKLDPEWNKRGRNKLIES